MKLGQPFLVAALIVTAVGLMFFKVAKPILLPKKLEVNLKCARPECGAEFAQKLPVGFREFPVVCPQCRQMTAQVRETCPQCGATYAVDFREPPTRCPKCDAEIR
jgi:DNA-directed RNA polymerase subunit RPC12/RpoP